jgi:uncharacterized membrane protein YqhA
VKVIERAFEAMLWSSRYLAILAVLASLAGSVAMFAVGVSDAVHTIGEAATYVLPHDAAASAVMERNHLRATIVAGVAEFIDGLLFAAVLLIFALGLYELFISKIDAAENSEFAGRLLLIRNLDDLKDRLAKVIFLILIVRYFEYALDSEVKSTIDLLYLAVGIALIAGALYLTKGKGGSEH